MSNLRADSTERMAFIRAAATYGEDYAHWPLVGRIKRPGGADKRDGGETVLMRAMEWTDYLFHQQATLANLTGVILNESVCGLPEPDPTLLAEVSYLTREIGCASRKVARLVRLGQAKWHHPDDLGREDVKQRILTAPVHNQEPLCSEGTEDGDPPF